MAKLFGVKVEVDATDAAEAIAAKRIEYKAKTRIRKATRLVRKEVEAQAVDALVEEMLVARGLRPAKPVSEA